MSVRKTSIETYNTIKSSGMLSEKRLRVYGIFFLHGNLTGAQVSEFYRTKFSSSKTSETIRNRITELVQMGVVDELGKTKCPSSKRDVTLFGLNNNLPKKLVLPKTINQKKTAILKSVTSFAKKFVSSEKMREELLIIYRNIEKINKKL